MSRTSNRKSYSDKQRRIMAASFYVMSQGARKKAHSADFKKFDRDVFFLLACIYINHHAEDRLNITELGRYIGKDPNTADNKLSMMSELGLITMVNDEEDGRAKVAVAAQPLFDFFEGLLDYMIHAVRMTVRCIENADRRNLSSRECEAFFAQIAKIARIE